MKLLWEIVYADWCGALPLEPDNILAHVWYEKGWRMSCAFAPDNDGQDDAVIYTDAGEAKGKAQEALDAWVQRHTLGWLVDPEAASIGAQLIDNERMRQIHEEGWTPSHDDEHRRGEMAAAGACYAYKAATQAAFQMGEWQVDEEWPWELDSWKPSDDPIRNLQKAGALIAAEIDRLIRAKGGAES
jgi:hypothetical protein